MGRLKRFDMSKQGAPLGQQPPGAPQAMSVRQGRPTDAIDSTALRAAAREKRRRTRPVQILLQDGSRQADRPTARRSISQSGAVMTTNAGGADAPTGIGFGIEHQARGSEESGQNVARFRTASMRSLPFVPPRDGKGRSTVPPLRLQLANKTCTSSSIFEAARLARQARLRQADGRADEARLIHDNSSSRSPRTAVRQAASGRVHVDHTTRHGFRETRRRPGNAPRPKKARRSQAADRGISPNNKWAELRCVRHFRSDDSPLHGRPETNGIHVSRR